MENKHDHNGSGFMNGLLLGVIIGAALVFFLGTKKGKKLLQAITDEGFEGMGELKALLTEDMDVEEEEASVEMPVHPDMSDETRPTSKVKRFFKRKK